MKTTVFLIASLLGFFMMSCQKDTMDPAAGTSDFESVALSAARYSVEADSTTRMKCKGKLTELAQADIPASVTAYIGTNYPAATLKFAGTDAMGNVVVGLILADGTHKGLLFAGDGTFKEELQHYGKHAKLTEVAVSDLPATAVVYVANTYPAAEIKRAGKNEAGELFVMLLVDSKPVVLLFNADGTFSKTLDKPGHHGKKFGPGHK